MAVFFKEASVIDPAEYPWWVRGCDSGFQASVCFSNLLRFCRHEHNMYASVNLGVIMESFLLVLNLGICLYAVTQLIGQKQKSPVCSIPPCGVTEA